MKSLIKNYLDKLDIVKLKEFGIKNDILLNDEEINFILNLVKNNFEDILINNDKYFDILKSKVSQDNFLKVKDLFLYYEKRYKGYLF